MTMNYLDNKCLHELHDELDSLIDKRKYIRQYRDIPEGYTMEEILTELDEEEIYLRMKIEELSIVQDDYSSDEF